MRRKLVQQGKSTLMVSLPKEWVDAQKLQKGDEVDISAYDGGLRVSTEVAARSETSVVLVGATESYVRTVITNTYRKGYDVIHVSYSSKEQFLALERVVRTLLIGFEITRSGERACVVENVTEPSPDQFDTIFRKLLLNMGLLLEQTDKHCQGLPLDEPESLIQERMLRYDNFCRRILSKRSTDETSMFTWTFLSLIIHAAREIHLVHTHVAPGYLPARRLVQDAMKIHSILSSAVVRGSITDKIEDVHKINADSQAYGVELMRSPSESVIAAHFLLDAVRRLYQANSPLIGMLA